jgi:hypothetical protein
MVYTKQSPQELEENIKAFKRMLGEKTRLNIVPEKGMTPQQLAECRHNAAAFDVRMAAVNTDVEGRVDYSVQNIGDAYKFLRDSNMLKFEVAPVIHKAPTLTDHRGNIVRDLRKERQEARERADREAKQPVKTLAQELENTGKRIAVNKGIENLRNEIASYTARTHSQTARARAEMTEVLNGVINGRRHMYDVMMAIDEIKKIGAKHWDN